MNRGEVAPRAGTPTSSEDRGLAVPASARVVARRVRLALAAALLGTVVFILLLGFGIVGNPWYHVVKIDGGSMAPTIARGELILVAPPPARVRPGMIVVMTVGNQVVTHRVVAVSASGELVTKGDANRVTDEWGGRPVRVVGQYVATIPWLGAVLPVPEVSAATFMERVTVTMSIQVGVLATQPVDATPSPASTPDPAATPTPAPTSTDSPSPTATETPAPTAADTPTPTPAATPDPAPTPSPTPTDTATPAPTDTATPTDVPTATPTSAATPASS
jgi:signal peptidase I